MAAGEVFSWAERRRRLSEVKVELENIDRIFRTGQTIQARELRSGNTQAGISNLLISHLAAMTEIELVLDSVLTSLLDANKIQTPPLVWKPGAIAGLHHWVFTPSGAGEAKLEALDGATNPSPAGIFDLLAVGDAVILKRARKPDNNLILEIASIAVAAIEFKGNLSALTQPTLDLNAVPLNPSGGNVADFITDTFDKTMEMHWLYDSSV